MSTEASNSGTDAQLTHWRELENYYKSVYEEQVKANNEAAADSTAQTLSVIEGQIASLTEEYRSADRQLYRDYMNSKKNLPQELALSGASGGLSESGRIALDTGYQEALNQSQRQRIAEISSLRSQGEEQRFSNEQKAAAANAEAKEEYYGYLASLKSSEYSALQKRAAELGESGDFSLYSSIGYSDEEVEKLRTAWEAANPELAVAAKAARGEYSAEDVAALPPVTAQQVLIALGYLTKTTGKWDAATEKAYRAAYGKASGNYKKTYSYSAVAGKTKTSAKKKTASGNHSADSGGKRGTGGIAVRL